MKSTGNLVSHGYKFNSSFKKSAVYFSMEIAVDQALKTYSGGLGFLAGSHMRSAYELKQNLIGISMLWKFGYYDQGRKQDNSMSVDFREKFYHFLADTGVREEMQISGHTVKVAAFYLAPETFRTVPLLFLTTDIDGNDHWARSLSYNLYDADPQKKVAQGMILGIGGVKILNALKIKPDVYHFNEAHAISAAFELFKTFKKAAKLREKMVFTTHTPEEAGNEKHSFEFLYHMDFFAGLPAKTVRKLTGTEDDLFNHSLAALRMSRKANGVSKLHGEVSRQMWSHYRGVCEITHITNAQQSLYWSDPVLKEAAEEKNAEQLIKRKRELKAELFKTVADQVGKLFDPNVFTLVWARRFAAYKRPDLITREQERFDKLLNNSKYPIQIIWAGKPYPQDHGAINTFNSLYYKSHFYKNMAVLTGYELGLSKLLKLGSDGWLNNPVVTREASGTSGMSAAMNASINISTDDGWICEFATKKNSFVVPVAPADSEFMRDVTDQNNLLDVIEKILPMYYDKPDQWNKMVFQSMEDVLKYFDSDRMAAEYYEKLY